MDECADRIAEVEPCIRTLANKNAGRYLSADDIAQELRIQALHLARRFDPAKGVPWPAYFGSFVHGRMVDVFRRYGSTNRAGEQKRVVAFNPQDVHHSDGETTRWDPECPWSAHGTSTVDWDDLVERSATEPPRVRALVLRCSGLSFAEIGRVLGVCESRACQFLKNPTDAIQRVTHMIQGVNDVDRPTLRRENYEHLDEETEELLGQVVRRVEIELYRRNVEAASEIVQDATEIWASAGKKRSAKLDDSINDLDLELRTVNNLEDNNVFTIEDLLRFPKAKFFDIAGFSDRSWERVCDALAAQGYEHGGNEANISQLARTGFRRPQSPAPAPEPPAPIQRKGPVPMTTEYRPAVPATDPIDGILQTLSTADESTLAKIDTKIAAKQSELDKLKRLRTSVAKIIGVSTAAKPRPSSSGQAGQPERLADRIFALAEASSNALTIQQVADRLGCKIQGVRMAITKSTNLREAGGMVVIDE